MALLLTFMLLCILYTEALLSPGKEIYSSRPEGPFEVHVLNITNCYLQKPDTPIVLKNLTLIKKKGNIVIFYEAEVVGDTKDGRINLKTGFMDKSKLVPIVHMKNLGCHTPFSSSLLRFFNLKLNSKNCSVQKGIIKAEIDVNDLIHKFLQQLWYGIGNAKIEFLRKKNGETHLCVDMWARIDPVTDKKQIK